MSVNRAMQLVDLPYARDCGARATRLSTRPGFVFLDSCRHAGTRGRYDILASDPCAEIVTVGPVTEIRRAGKVERSAEDPFALAVRELDAMGRCESDLPFAGGAIGYFGYDLGRRVERLPVRARRDIDLPDMWLGLYEHAIVVDHMAACAWLVSHPAARTSSDPLRQAWSAQVAVTPAAFTTSFEVTSAVRPEIDFAAYAQAWHRIRHYITEGDVYQVNLAQRFSAAVRGSAWDAYLRLRCVNPAPFSAFLQPPGGAILSTSPERFLQIAAGRVETRPIKGTRRRSADPAEDQRLAAELAASDKDRAENVMIVDLLRNDLGRTCRIGSVEVPSLFSLETYARVHHLVSTVCGELAPGRHPLEVVRACFPGGSITGAPKIRAMQIIEELEPCRRGVYCGAIGYASCSGVLDTNIAIRTLVRYHDRLYCWAGGGIVVDSELEAEYQECFAKAAAMLEVFNDAEIEGLGDQAGR
jgi:para-aminobenzoate synthetase component 1